VPRKKGRRPTGFESNGYRASLLFKHDLFRKTGSHFAGSCFGKMIASWFWNTATDRQLVPLAADFSTASGLHCGQEASTVDLTIRSAPPRVRTANVKSETVLQDDILLVFL
jgi:hypothetical protein